MVRRGSTVRVRQRASQKGLVTPLFSGQQLSILKPDRRLGTGFGDRFRSRTNGCGQRRASVEEEPAPLRKPCRAVCAAARSAWGAQTQPRSESGDLQEDRIAASTGECGG